MIKIAILQAAFESIARTLPFGGVGYENAVNEKGERLIWLEPRVVDRLRLLRGPGGELQRRHFAAGVGRRLNHCMASDATTDRDIGANVPPRRRTVRWP